VRPAPIPIASLFVLTDALLCRAGGAKGARRAAFRLDAIPLRTPFPSFSSNRATLGTSHSRSRRAGPCCRSATARPSPPRLLP
jgi:hypothetical protein